MMIIINRSDSHITGSVNGQPFAVRWDEAKYNLMLELQQKAGTVETVADLKSVIEEFLPLTQESYKDLIETRSGYIYVNPHTNKFYLKYGNTISSQPLPQVFVDKIIKSVEKGIDIEPLIKCWARYMRPVPGRPKYNVEEAKLFAQYIDADFVNTAYVNELKETKGIAAEVATQMATQKQVAITQEGLIVGYKVSREILHRYQLNENEDVVTRSRYQKKVDPNTGLISYDEPDTVEDRLFQPYCMGQSGDAFYCGEELGHFIKVGQVHYLDDWKKVGAPGSKGLHVGGLKYISGYQNGEGAVTHNVFIDPMDIHSISGLGYGNDGAMTVKRYFVHSSFAGPNRNIYHSSKYAALTDSEYALLVQEAVKATEASKKELESILEETKSLSQVHASSKGGYTAQGTKDLFSEQ